jgi:hypothetical protein
LPDGRFPSGLLQVIHAAILLPLDIDALFKDERDIAGNPPLQVLRRTDQARREPFRSRRRRFIVASSEQGGDGV